MPGGRQAYIPAVNVCPFPRSISSPARIQTSSQKSWVIVSRVSTPAANRRRRVTSPVSRSRARIFCSTPGPPAPPVVEPATGSQGMWSGAKNSSSGFGIRESPPMGFGAVPVQYREPSRLASSRSCRPRTGQIGESRPPLGPVASGAARTPDTPAGPPSRDRHSRSTWRCRTFPDPVTCGGRRSTRRSPDPFHVNPMSCALGDAAPSAVVEEPRHRSRVHRAEPGMDEQAKARSVGSDLVFDELVVLGSAAEACGQQGPLGSAPHPRRARSFPPW